MKLHLQIAALLLVFLIIPVKLIFAENYHIAGYVLHENDSTPVRNEIVEIRDQSGANIISFLTNDHGLYSGFFEVSPAYSPYVIVELSRHCGDSIIIYNEEINLENPYLTSNFFVCNARPCHANFSYFQMGLESLIFEFTDVSEGDVTSWLWDFEDGQFSTLQNPTHEFEQPGTYHVKLTITGVNCDDSRVKPVFAHFDNCVAQFSYEQLNQGNNLVVQFTDKSLGNFDEWFWDFDDGTYSNEQNPIHVYDHAGNYEVELSISGLGCSSNNHQPILVLPGPDCFALFNSNQLNAPELKVEFTDLSIGEADSWLWDFGDGNTSDLQNPIHHYENPGDFEVSLTISNPNCDDSFTRPLTVKKDTTCQANFDYQQNSVLEPIIEFTNLSIGDDLLYFWDFGDGGTSQETSPVHEFDALGIYDVKLKVVGQGCGDSLTKQIEVIGPAPCQADFSYSSQSPEALEISFINQSTGAINSFEWDFGDGNFSTEENPVHAYSQPGIYIVELAVFAEGCADSIQKTVEITEPVFCEAEFSFTSQSPEALEISFTNQSTGTINSFEWDFGDGNFSIEENPVHSYSQPGSYIVELAVFAEGCADSIQKTIEITEPVLCEAAFLMEQEYPQSRLVSFINQSVGNNLSSSWDFGDGSFSTETNPQHEYGGPGLYTVTLSISSTNFCSDTLSENLEILPALKLSGSVLAGTNTLKLGNVFLYKKETSGLLNIFGQSSLETGSFNFSGLTPGNYFVQAIPDFSFPYPVIPNYFPTYSGGKKSWSEALIFETGSLPENIEINLLHFDDFFDGEASISGKVVLNQGTQSFPVIIYLTDEMNTLLSYKIPDEQSEFEFSAIAYGNYNIYPEKAGKTGQAFSVELTEAKPGSHGIIFNETETAIIPDLTAINDLNEAIVLISPNPAGDFVNLQIKNAFQNKNCLTIYKSDKSIVATYASIGSSFVFDVSGLSNGLYFLGIETVSEKIFRKLIIQH